MKDSVAVSSSPVAWILLAFAVLLLPLPWLLAFLVSSLFHELFHYAAVRLCGCRVTELQFRSDGVHMNTTSLLPLQAAFCSLAGPVGALMLLALSRWMPRVALCAAIQSAYHLLPIYPLDGGRALQSISDYFGWNNRIAICIEFSVLCGIALFGIYSSVSLRLGVIPIFLSLGLIFRTVREKYLANRSGKGYNIPTN